LSCCEIVFLSFFRVKTGKKTYKDKKEKKENKASHDHKVVP